MAWSTVDKDDSEFISNIKPVRILDNWRFSEEQEETYEISCIELPKGTIIKMTDEVLIWEDEPVEIK